MHGLWIATAFGAVLPALGSMIYMAATDRERLGRCFADLLEPHRVYMGAFILMCVIGSAIQGRTRAGTATRPAPAASAPECSAPASSSTRAATTRTA